MIAKKLLMPEFVAEAAESRRRKGPVSPVMRRLGDEKAIRPADGRFVVLKPGTYVVFFANYSGRVQVIIKTQGAKVYIYGLYYGKDNDRFHLETVQDHQIGGSSSDLLVKGVFDDQSRFGFKGLIKIRKSAQRSYAYQRNKNLMLSDTAMVESAPFLEIEADDVFCTHSLTIGSLSEEEIYYLQTRGIDRRQAEKLLVDGFLNERE
ncbi:MAG: SufD family Fe-S cluster assembly protein [bacterium]|nr:SufD family Fe-S cluster assembly protein [bacterium]